MHKFYRKQLNTTMGIADNLRVLDAHSSVSKEFRVYTIQGAVLSVLTVVGKPHISFRRLLGFPMDHV